MKTGITLIFAVLLTGCSTPQPWHPVIQSEFHSAILNADLVLLREPYLGEQRGIIIHTVRNHRALHELYDSIIFVEHRQQVERCWCSGYPVVEWYKGQGLLARASIQHCDAIRWSGFTKGDMPLTQESQERLRSWLLSHGAQRKQLR